MSTSLFLDAEYACVIEILSRLLVFYLYVPCKKHKMCTFIKNTKVFLLHFFLSDINVLCLGNILRFISFIALLVIEIRKHRSLPGS